MQRERDTEIDRQTETKRERQRDRERGGGGAVRQTETNVDRQTERQTDNQIQTDGQRESDKQTKRRWERPATKRYALLQVGHTSLCQLLRKAGNTLKDNSDQRKCSHSHTHTYKYSTVISSGLIKLELNDLLFTIFLSCAKQLNCLSSL